MKALRLDRGSWYPGGRGLSSGVKEIMGLELFLHQRGRMVEGSAQQRPRVREDWEKRCKGSPEHGCKMRSEVPSSWPVLGGKRENRQQAFQEDSLQEENPWMDREKRPAQGQKGNMQSGSSFAHQCFSTDLLLTSHPCEECPLVEQAQHSWPQGAGQGPEQG